MGKPVWPWIITFIPQASKPEQDPTVKRPWEGQDPSYRVKRLLKIALRHMGLRCVEAKTFDPEYASTPIVNKPRKQSKGKSKTAA